MDALMNTQNAVIHPQTETDASEPSAALSQADAAGTPQTFAAPAPQTDASARQWNEMYPEINTAEAAKKKERLCRIPVWVTLASYIVGFLWITCFAFPYGWMPCEMITLFTAVFLLWGELAMKKIPREGKESWFWAACMVAISIGIDIPGGIMHMHGWDYFALHCTAIYWILCRSGKLIDKKTGPMFILDAITGAVIAPLRGIPNRIKRIVYGFTEENNNSTGKLMRTIGTSLVSIILVLPILALVINLLAKVDSTFGDVVRTIISSIVFDRTTILRFILGVFASSVFFSILSSCVAWEKPVFSGQKVRENLESFRVLPTGSCITIYGVFISVYLLFFGVQGSHLIGAFWGEIPGQQTAAEFARHGFFELCTVMAINFGIILGCSVLSKVPMRKSLPLRTMAHILLSESILLAITAGSKLILYIERFGFTQLRLLSFWAVLILTCGCVLSILAVRNNKSYFDKWVWFSAASFVPLCFF